MTSTEPTKSADGKYLAMIVAISNGFFACRFCQLHGDSTGVITLLGFFRRTDFDGGQVKWRQFASFMGSVNGLLNQASMFMG